MDLKNGGEDFMNKGLILVYHLLKVSLKLMVYDAKSIPKTRDKPRAYSK
jgi:hypothetical protein